MPRYPVRALPIASAQHADELDRSLLAVGALLEFVAGVVPVALLAAVDPLPTCETARDCSANAGLWVRSDIALALTAIGIIMVVAVIPISVGVSLRHRAWIAACAAAAMPSVVVGACLGVLGARLLSPGAYAGVWSISSPAFWAEHVATAALYGLLGAAPLVALFALIGTEVVIQER